MRRGHTEKWGPHLDCQHQLPERSLMPSWDDLPAQLSLWLLKPHEWAQTKSAEKLSNSPKKSRKIINPCCVKSLSLRLIYYAAHFTETHFLSSTSKTIVPASFPVSVVENVSVLQAQWKTCRITHIHLPLHCPAPLEILSSTIMTHQYSFINSYQEGNCK